MPFSSSKCCSSCSSSSMVDLSTQLLWLLLRALFSGSMLLGL